MRRLCVQNAPVSIDRERDTAIVAVEARLRELDAAREAATRELAELRAQSERAISDGGGEDEPDRAASWTPQRKVALFASLFLGTASPNRPQTSLFAGYSKNGPCRNRTCNLGLKRPLLCRLS